MILSNIYLQIFEELAECFKDCDKSNYKVPGDKLLHLN